jgi:hypothetical protein
MNKIKKLISSINEKQLILHTPLISIVYALGVYRVIVESNYPVVAAELIIAFVIILILTLFCYAFSKLILKNKIKSAIAATLFLGYAFNSLLLTKYFFGFNLLTEVSDNLFNGIQLIASSFLLLIVLSILLFTFSKLPFKLIRFNNYLNFLLVIFLAFEIVSFFTFEPKRIRLSDNVQFHPESVKNNKELPSIYYIVFDSYTNFESLKKYWNYDNSELREFLSERNFYIAEKSRSTYNQTHFTLASTLNLSYLEYESFKELTIAHYPNLFNLIKNNKLIKVLESAGYKIRNYSLFDISNKPKFYRFDVIDEPGFFQNTLFKPFIDIGLIGSLFELTFHSDQYSYRTNIEMTEQLVGFASNKNQSPYFAYVHFMIPHSPYYFDAKGSLMHYTYASDQSDMWKYLEQLKYTNKILMKIVEHILTNLEHKPVIIIQGDHGFRRLKDKKEQGAESHSMLNAFYFPDGDYNVLYENISSVNTFRVLLNKLNLTDVLLMPDKSFFVAKGIGF